MASSIIGKRIASGWTVVMLIACACAAGLLTSCSTPGRPETPAAGDSAFRFWVLLYKTPIQVSPWIPSSAVTGDPEGAALNIATAMQQGNLEQWRANWRPTEQPNLSPVDQQTLLQQWQAIHGSNIQLRGRVVAGTVVIVELSLISPQGQAQRLQVPVARANDRWWLTTINPASEYLHWENSGNKMVQYLDPASFQQRIAYTQTSVTKL